MNGLGLISAIVGLSILCLVLVFGNKIVNRPLKYLVIIAGVIISISVVGNLPMLLGDSNIHTSSKAGEYMVTLGFLLLIVKPFFFKKRGENMQYQSDQSSSGQFQGSKKDNSFPKKAAYFSIASPFIASMVQTIGKGTANASDLIILGTAGIILLSGISLGLYAIFQSKKYKGVLVPSSVGIVLHVLIIAIASKAFIDYRNKYQYYEVTAQIVTEEMDIRQIQFGRISPSMNVDEVVNMISSEITSKCQDCEILSTETADTLPEKYMGIFSSKQFDFTYVAVATNNRNTGDIRYIFPDLDPQPGCDDLSDYVNTQKQLFKDIGVVTCVDPADSEARKQALIALDEYGSGLEKESEHDYEGARLHFEQAVALKPEDPVYLDALAKVLYVLADYEGTLLAFEKSTEIYRQKHGDDHPEVAINLTAIGAVLDELGEYAKAIEYHEKALEILISNYGENHELVANALNNLGMSLEKLEVYERARGLIEKALAINKALLGAEHPVVASNYSNLGSISEKMGEYQKAIEYKEHALMLGRKEYGNDHPKIALRLNNVGWTCYLMGDYQKALQCYEEAETIYLKYFTEDHPDIQLLRDNMELVKVKL